MEAVRTLYTYEERIHASEPAWVPSGKRVVVIDGLTFVTIDLESSEITRVRDNGPALPSHLSSSWHGLVFESRSGSGEIWTMNSFGGQHRLVASGRRPRWSPRGDAIAFVGQIADRAELLVMRPAGIPYWSVAKDCNSSSAIGWSPNGTQLVYVNSQNYISLVGFDGSDNRILVPHSVPGGWWCWGDHPEWSPSGDLIAYGQRSAEHHVFVVSLDGSLVQKHLGFDVAIWSPDGDRLILTNDDEIHIVDVHSGTPRFLTKGRLPAWSPNGKRIVFVSEGSIHVIEL